MNCINKYAIDQIDGKKSIGSIAYAFEIKGIRYFSCFSFTFICGGSHSMVSI